MVPWGALLEHPTLFITVPFLWLLWQIYLPRSINRLVGKSPADGFLYDTWWTKIKQEFKSEFSQVDQRVDKMGSDIESIADTQKRLVRVTIAQSHMLNGYDGELDVEEVKNDLRKEDERSATDYLDEDQLDDKYTDDDETNRRGGS